MAHLLNGVPERPDLEVRTITELLVLNVLIWI